MRIIQVPVANRSECSHALNFAFKVASKCNANVMGVHVRSFSGMKDKPIANKGWWKIWSEDVDWQAQTEKQSLSNSKEAHDLFEKLAEKNGFPLQKNPPKGDACVANWHERVGTPDYIMPLIGPMADMMVVSRPAKKGGKKAKVFMMQALMHSHRPVFVLPNKAVKSVASNIVIGWNRTGESARVLHASLPLLEKADKVTLVTVGQPTGSGPRAKEMAQFLKFHGIKADVKTIPNGKHEEEILKVCKDVGADLLVAGAYSRSRASEFLFGGVTDHMLFSADIPVLMLHS